MNNIGFLRLIFISIIFISQLATANIALPKLISDGMVLQRDKTLKIWGWADAYERVSVTFNGKTYVTTTESNKKWELEESLQSFPEIERAYQEINKTMISRIDKMKLRETLLSSYFKKSKDLDNTYTIFSACNFKPENW